MRAAVFNGPHDIRIEEVKKPEINNNEILIDVEACGICGSDLHMYKFDLFTEGLCKTVDGKKIPGHEFTGTVIEVGEKVKNIEKGERVVAFAFGGMAEYVSVAVIPGFNVFKLPPEVSFEGAATFEPLSNSVHEISLAKPTKDENVIVYGTGAIGLGVIQCLRAMEYDLNKIIAVDVSDYRLKVAKQIGADEIVNASDENFLARIFEHVGNDPYPFTVNTELMSPAVDIVFDCVGFIKDRPEPLVIQQAINVVRALKGRVIVHGIFEENVNLNLLPFVIKQINLIGSFGFVPQDHEKSLNLLQTRKINRKEIISHEFPLDNAKEGFEVACDVNQSLKVLLKP